MRPSQIEKHIYKSLDSGKIFQLDFAVLFLNLFCEQNKLGT